MTPASLLAFLLLLPPSFPAGDGGAATGSLLAQAAAADTAAATPAATGDAAPAAPDVVAGRDVVAAPDVAAGRDGKPRATPELRRRRLDMAGAILGRGLTARRIPDDHLDPLIPPIALIQGFGSIVIDVEVPR